MRVRYKIPEIFLGALLAVAIFAMGMSLGSSSQTPASDQDSKQKSNRIQANPESHFDKLFDPQIIFNFMIMIFTGLIVVITRSQRNDSRVIQRAYVKISHCAPGVIFRDDGWMVVEFEITNFGSTPATVTCFAINHLLRPPEVDLPKVPPKFSISAKEQGGSFLVMNDKFFISKKFPITIEQIGHAKKKSLFIHVYGHVDYIDAFGARHRSGYGRTFSRAHDTGPIEQRNNLNIIPLSSYNYDRPRRCGEGDDWDN